VPRTVHPKQHIRLRAGRGAIVLAEYGVKWEKILGHLLGCELLPCIRPEGNRHVDARRDSVHQHANRIRDGGRTPARAEVVLEKVMMRATFVEYRRLSGIHAR
jgi:hypothetical protein